MTLLTALLLGLTMAGVLSAQPASTRPPQAMQASITWLYYKDLPAAMRFYEGARRGCAAGLQRILGVRYGP